jgi:hypothetical protein
MAGTAPTTLPTPRGDDDNELDDFQLPLAGGGDDFDGLPRALSPLTCGNNRAPCHLEIKADLNPLSIIEGRRNRNRNARVHFTSATSSRLLCAYSKVLRVRKHQVLIGPETLRMTDIRHC